MHRLRKLLILDDDTHYSGLLALKLRQRFPELMISSFDKSDLMWGYDIYILDNDFGGNRCGADLAEKVREKSPQSLVLILSGTLEKSLLKRLVNCHAAGVFDKSEPSELDDMTALMERYLLLPTPTISENQKSGLSATASGIRALIAEWNRRLAFEEKRT